MTVDYGMHYSGFGDRLLVTPLTDRCYVALMNSFRDSAVPLLHGNSGTGKKTCVTELAYQLGVDVFERDCGAVDNFDSIYNPIQAAVGCGMWLLLSNSNKLIER
jgi:hypothetical protein